MDPSNPYLPPQGGGFQQPQSGPPQGDGPAAQLKIPAIFMLITGGLGVLNNLFSLVTNSSSREAAKPSLDQFPEQLRPMMEQSFTYAPFVSALGLILCGLVIAGAVMMLTKKNYGLAMAGAIAGVIPCLGPCCCMAIPFSIWALVLLLRDEVKAAFAANAGGGSNFQPPSAGPGFQPPA